MKNASAHNGADMIMNIVMENMIPYSNIQIYIIHTHAHTHKLTIKC